MLHAWNKGNLAPQEAAKRQEAATKLAVVEEVGKGWETLGGVLSRLFR